MTRMTARQLAFQLLFTMEARGLSPEEAVELFFAEPHYDGLQEEDPVFQEKPDEEQMAYIQSIAKLSAEHREEADMIIRRFSEKWKPERLSLITLSVLRCALCEILYMDDIPTAVSVNEAVELAKRYDSPETAAYINGVLGAYLRSEKK